MTTNRKKKQEPTSVIGRIYAYLLRKSYKYRAWWVDIPIGALLLIYYLSFFSHGTYVVPDGMPQFCWGILGLYLAVKEGVRWNLHEIQSRRGSIMVAVWMLTLTLFWLIISIGKNSHAIPHLMVTTTTVILLGFLGIKVGNLILVKKFSALREVLFPPDEKK